MTKEMIKALELDKIFELFFAEGELMSRARTEGLRSGTSDLKKVRADYLRIRNMISALSTNRQNRFKLRELLAHLPVIRIPERDQIQCQHELYELKVFCHYYLLLRDLLGQLAVPEDGSDSSSPQRRLSGQYRLDDLSGLYALLDPDKQKMPVFRLRSGALDTMLEELRVVNLKLNQERGSVLEQAKAELENPRLRAEFILSPRETEQISVIETGGFFLRVSETAGGISYKLADSSVARELASQAAELINGIKLEEDRLVEDLSKQVRSYSEALNRAIHTAKQLSWDFLRADFGIEYKCCIPKLVTKPGFCLKGSRNLPLQLRLKEKNRHYQELDLDFREARVNLITGPNMGGKTTILKNIGQAVELARLGIPLPAREAALCLTEYVWMNHASETTGENLSSFGKEVVSLIGALRRGGYGLFLLDEFAKGTNPTEGEAICSAVLEYLSGTKHICLASTHFTAPTALAEAGQYMTAGFDPVFLKTLGQDSDLEHRLRHLSEAMDYRLIKLSRRQSPPRAAVRIARALGLPEEILSLIPKELT